MRGGWAIITALTGGLLLGGSIAAPLPTIADQRARLATAKSEAAAAATRAAILDRRAATERDAAARARAQEAALRSRVTAAQADLVEAQARAALVGQLLARQQARLGAAQAPVARLLAALESLARRPTIVAVAQPGSVDDLVHVRAVLGSALPVVRDRTRTVRAAVATTRRLRAGAMLAAAALRDGRARLEASRVALARVEADHRRRGQALGRQAMSESDRAIAMGERARDLVDRLDEEGAAQATATGLVSLAGPIARPLASGTRPPSRVRGAYRLPVTGRLVTGLDELSASGVRSRGLTFAVGAGADVVAPAAGTVRYARPFRGYGTIVIIDHGDGWSTLVTGLRAASVRPGMRVASGDRLGNAATGEDPQITVELRRRGHPMDIAALLG